jgi:DNA-binding MarR family transcriptional regulator
LVARLESRKRATLGPLLFQAARILNERAMARVQARVPAARLAHTQLLPHIDLDGTRPTEIARRAGITKQAVGQLVDEMVALGMLERRAEPDDARAQRIGFTDDGIAQLLAGLDVLDAIELDLGGDVGVALLERLHRDLARLIPALQKL